MGTVATARTLLIDGFSMAPDNGVPAKVATATVDKPPLSEVLNAERFRRDAARFRSPHVSTGGMRRQFADRNRVVIRRLVCWILSPANVIRDRLFEVTMIRRGVDSAGSINHAVE